MDIPEWGRLFTLFVIRGSVIGVEALTWSLPRWLRRDGGTLEDEVTRLYIEHRAPLQRYVQSMGLAAGDGEDVAQEVFLALFEHLRKGRPADHLRGWIFRVGHNLALKRRMGAGREVAIDAGLAAAVANPEEQVAWQRRQERLRAVVGALPERDRCCLTLRAEGLRYREIAAALGMSLGAVAASLSRSLGKLAAASRRG